MDVGELYAGNPTVHSRILEMIKCVTMLDGNASKDVLLFICGYMASASYTGSGDGYCAFEDALFGGITGYETD